MQSGLNGFDRKNFSMLNAKSMELMSVREGHISHFRVFGIPRLHLTYKSVLSGCYSLLYDFSFRMDLLSLLVIFFFQSWAILSMLILYVLKFLFGTETKLFTIGRQPFSTFLYFICSPCDFHFGLFFNQPIFF